ncbi:MAG: UDP-N-acetylglucosamine 2-epimerase, partial [Bacteroidota bacterium]
FFKKFCITLRDETEWVELVDDGFNFLAGSNTENILNSFNIIEGLKDKKFSDALYGNGTAGKIIVKTLLENT